VVWEEINAQGVKGRGSKVRNRTKVLKGLANSERKGTPGSDPDFVPRSRETQHNGGEGKSRKEGPNGAIGLQNDEKTE